MTDQLTVLLLPLDVMQLADRHLDILRRAHPRVRVEPVADAQELAARLPDADAALTGYPIPAGALPAAPRVRWLQWLPVGVDQFLTPDVRAAAHVQLTASKGPMAIPIAEHAIALLLALARRLPDFGRQQAVRRWDRIVPLTELHGKTALVLGVGAVGGEVARMLHEGFRMQVLGTARTRRDNPHVARYVERDELHGALAEADAVILTLPGTAETRGILDRAALATMKPTAYLIDVARGVLVNEDALIAQLRDGRLGGAGLDAVAGEPLAPESPLWMLPNVIITPHQSPVTDQWIDHLVAFWAENIRRFAEGEPLRAAVDRDAGY